jgi:glycosidase
VVLSAILIAGCGGEGQPDADSAPASTPLNITADDGVGEPDWVKDIVMYEIFVPDFSEEGTFQGVVERLDSLKAMGVNTLWLMPIHPVGEKRAKTDIGPLGSPYAVKDYKAANPQYGGDEGFRKLVEEVHSRDMYIIIDWVANHTAWDHPWVSEHPEYYTEGPVDGRFTYPLLDGDTTDWTDVVDLNFENQEMRTKMIDAMKFWVEEYNIDGFRCDVAHQVPLDFWNDAIDTLETVRPVLMLAEAAEPEMHSVGFDLTYAWPFYGTIKRVWEEGAPVSELITQADTTLEDLPGPSKRLRFTTNHDETAWDAPPTEIFGGEEGAEAAFVLATSMPGVPLIYNGQELGIQDTISFFEATPYDWSTQNETRSFYANYVAFYAESEALRNGDYEVLTPDAEDAVILSRSAGDEELLVLVNVRDKAVDMQIPAEYTEETLVDVLTGQSVPGMDLTLDPYAYHILRVTP